MLEKIKNSTSTLFILCGFPYTGKSYIAKEIIKETDITVVSIDDIFYQKGFDWDTDNLPDAVVWKEIFDIAFEKTKELLLSGKNVLFPNVASDLF